jgi:hypothetical protein
VVNGADPQKFGFMEVDRLGDVTVIQAINLNISDCYWIIYAPDIPPSDAALDGAGGGGFERGLRHARHIEGPWYSVTF